MKKLFSVIMSLMMVAVLSISAFANDYLIPMTLQGATKKVTITIDAQKDDRRESYPLEFSEGNNYQVLRRLEPNTYHIKNAVDEDDNPVLLNSYTFVVEDNPDTQEIVLSVVDVSEEEVEKYSRSLSTMLGIGSNDIAVFVIFIGLAVVYFSMKAKDNKAIKEAVEEASEDAAKETESRPAIKITEYDPESENNEKGRGDTDE